MILLKIITLISGKRGRGRGKGRRGRGEGGGEWGGGGRKTRGKGQHTNSDIHAGSIFIIFSIKGPFPHKYIFPM